MKSEDKAFLIGIAIIMGALTIILSVGMLTGVIK